MRLAAAAELLRRERIPFVPGYPLQLAWAAGLLAAALSYGLALPLFAPYAEAASFGASLEYGLLVWVLAGGVSFVYLAAMLAAERAILPFYCLWSLSLPIVEILFSLDRHGHHWVLGA